MISFYGHVFSYYINVESRKLAPVLYVSLTFSVLPHLGSFPSLTQKLLSQFLETFKHENNNFLVNFLKGSGVKLFVFNFEETIVTGTSLGAMPPGLVDGVQIRQQKIGMVTMDF